MLPTKEQLAKMSLKQIEDRLHGCSPGSDAWSVVWPVYETRRRRGDAIRTWVCFGVSTIIGLAALSRTFLPPAQARVESPKITQRTSDPLGLFQSNPQLQACLKNVSADDPLGIKNDDPRLDASRKECISQFANKP